MIARLEIPAGYDIGWAISKAMSAAKAIQGECQFDFNGVEIEVDECTDPALMENEYRRRLHAKRPLAERVVTDPTWATWRELTAYLLFGKWRNAQ